MTIEALIKVVPPPSSPTYAFDGPWEAVEAEIGTPLPDDYKELVRLYGSGLFMDFLAIYSPAGPSERYQLVPEAYDVLNFFRQYAPHVPIYPRPGGLLVCGTTNTGEYIFWLTRGLVSEWPIVIWDHEADEGEELEVFECDLTDFLAGLISGDIRPQSAPEDLDLNEGEPAFRSAPDPWPEAP